MVEFNTPLDSRELVRSFSGYLADHITLTPSFSVDLGAVADFSRGSVPAQSGSQPDLIAWNSLSPRAGFAWQFPHSHGLILRGAYSRLYAPLAGRYLDFGNPNSLGGSVYQWIAPDAAAPFQPSEQGPLLMRFGGLYSSISPTLRRPYSDEFDVGADYRLAAKTTGRYSSVSPRRQESYCRYRYRRASHGISHLSPSSIPVLMEYPGHSTTSG